MKKRMLLLCVGLVLCGCASKEARERAAYLAALHSTEREYDRSAKTGYVAELRLAEYIKESIARGVAFPDKKLLMWVYARAGIAAEFSGQCEEADQMYRFAEMYRGELFPGQPFDKSGQFKTIRDAVLYMDRNSGVSWLKDVQ